MSQENVEIVKHIYDEWGRGNFRGGTELYDPNITLVLQPDLPDAGAYTGTEAVAGYMHNFLESWAVVTISADELRKAGDSVLAHVIQRGTGTASGAETELSYFQLWTFRGGKVIRLESIPNADEAHDAAGLPMTGRTAQNPGGS